MKQVATRRADVLRHMVNYLRRFLNLTGSKGKAVATLNWGC
jgi:hypothetical protein